MLAVRVSASAVSCALLFIIIWVLPRRPSLPPLSTVITSDLLLVLLPISRLRYTFLLLPLTGATPMTCLALPLPIIAALEANVGTNAAARQAAVDSAAIVATAPRDNMRSVAGGVIFEQNYTLYLVLRRKRD